MNYNESLQAKNSRIQTLISKVNELPERGNTIVDDLSKQIIDGTITEITDDRMTTIRPFAFAKCSKLKTVNFPLVTDIGSSAFCYSGVETISFPLAKTIHNNAFEGCDFSVATFPVTTIVSSYAFSFCRLRTITFSSTVTINRGAFNHCYWLQSIYLTSPTICILNHSFTFQNTPYDGFKDAFSGTPYIYVPASLVSAYKSATNWTYFSAYIRAI